MNTYRFTIKIEAETQEQAEKVLWSRIGYDEDLEDDGVYDYTIDLDQQERGPVNQWQRNIK
jgi:hypothetical protein